MATSHPAPASKEPFALVDGDGGLQKLMLVAGDGARAEVYLHGAHVTSWIPAGEQTDRLFVSGRSNFRADAPIRGGIPVCFPQFASQGPLPAHGFARVSRWDMVDAHRTDAGAARAILRLRDTAATRALWPHAFVAELCVTVTGRMFDVLLSIENSGDAPFSFTGALHTYLRVADVGDVAVRGLQGARYYDKVEKRDNELEIAPELRVDRPLDRIYYTAPENLAMFERDHGVAIRASGFADTVVWNPGEAGGAGIADLEAGGYARMVCVEAAAARRPISVAAGEFWRGGQMLAARG